MADKHTNFWIALLNLGNAPATRARLWNGYLYWKLPDTIKTGEHQEGWPKLVVNPPEGGWPELTGEEKETIEALARKHGGHPEFKQLYYMNLGDRFFTEEIDLSGLIFVNANFGQARFQNSLSSDKTRFYGHSSFDGARFFSSVHFYKAYFDAPVSFNHSHFMSGAIFIGVVFAGGASFNHVVFERQAMFNDSQFEERYFSGGAAPVILTDFTNARFKDRALFREVLFGRNDKTYSRRIWPHRRVDFSSVEFSAATDFRKAIFGGVPAFFNATLHEDTDFGGVDWTRTENSHDSIEYTIRAWERLELIMSRLEKPLDRHQFFRLKMRARRRKDNRFLIVMNWLFEKTADYGWGVERAFFWWLGHWTVSGIVLFANTVSIIPTTVCWKLLPPALSIGFANAHAFLFLPSNSQYLAAYRKLLEQNNEWGLLNVVGTVEAFLGPISLFLLLLTIRNRFRLT